MRLFGKVDGNIDRFDRAGWLTPPFDLQFANRVAARRLSLFGRVNGQIDSIDRAGWLTTPFGAPLAAPNSVYVPHYLPPSNYVGPLCVSWALGSFETRDSQRFWADVCRLGSPGPSLAQLLDVRTAPTTPTTAINLPATINPLEFLTENVLRGQTELVRVNAGGVGPLRLDALAGAVLPRIVPPHTLLIIQIAMPMTVENAMVLPDNGVNLPAALATTVLGNAKNGWAPPANGLLTTIVAPLWSV